MTTTEITDPNPFLEWISLPIEERNRQVFCKDLHLAIYERSGLSEDEARKQFQIDWKDRGEDFVQQATILHFFQHETIQRMTAEGVTKSKALDELRLATVSDPQGFLDAAEMWFESTEQALRG